MHDICGPLAARIGFPNKGFELVLSQMTVVEAYIGRNKLDPPDDSTRLPGDVFSLLCEGIAQNTQGNVFVPQVRFSFWKTCYSYSQSENIQ